MVDARTESRAEARNGHHNHPAAAPGPDALSSPHGTPAAATHPGGAGPLSSALPPEAVDTQLDDAHTFQAFYVSHVDGRIRPKLFVFDGTPEEDEWSNLIGHDLEREWVGVVRLPVGPEPTHVSIEAAAWNQFGTYQGRFGRPVDAESVGLDSAAQLIGTVAAVILNWPWHAPAGGGPATVEAVARVVRRHVDDVRNAFCSLRLDQSTPTRQAGFFGYAIGETGPDVRDYHGPA